MGRLLPLLMAILPFVVYWLFLAFTRARRIETDGKFNPRPYVWLLICGLTLSALSMVYLGLAHDGDGERTPEPTRVIDGKIIRGG
ncbi:MAG: hypothetical protein AAGF19_10425 [Pseudomonadota bacterium]